MSDTKEENTAPWRHGEGTVYDFKDWARDSDNDLSDTFDPELGHPSAYQVLDMIQTWVRPARRQARQELKCAARRAKS